MGHNLTGKWQKGLKEGLGKMTYADGGYYEGGWLSDVCEGEGF
ncbi:MAG: hypothetical protein K6E37_06835 [Bacteroidales bacterium]|nr:hypothetical protein [Bacteroidales bacterium]